MEQFAQLPGNSLRNLYADGCNVVVASTTTATVQAGQVRSVNNAFDILIPSDLTLNMTATGKNGLDAGTFSPSSIYYVFVLYDQSSKTYGNACVASLSATDPVMPSENDSTYSDKRMVGVLFTNAATELLPFDVSGTGHVRHYQWWSPIGVLAGGVAVVDTPVSLATAMPSFNYGRVQLASSFTPAAPADTADIKSFAATASMYTQSGIVAAVAQNDLFEIIPTDNAGAPTVNYVLSAAGSLSLSVTGFELIL